MLIVEPTQLYEVRHNIVQDLLIRASNIEHKDLIRDVYLKVSEYHSALALALINLTHKPTLRSKQNLTSMTLLKDYAEELIKTLDIQLQQL